MPALPKLNTATPAVREFLFNVATYWIDFGIDGWRLDVPADIDDDEFWREFRRRVKAANPEAYIVGEIWHESQRWLQGDQFDAVMNYLVTKACLGYFVGDQLLRSESNKCGYHHIDTLDDQAFAHEIQRCLGLYAWPITEAQLNLLGSHDTPRFKTLARCDTSAYRLALLFLMTHPGPPCIYYGDEIGLNGGHDPGPRGGFPWDENQWDHGLRAYVQQCISLRKSQPALRRGDLTWLHAGQGVVAYGRRLRSDTLVVILNNSHQAAALDVPVAGYLANGHVLQDLWSDQAVTVSQDRIRGLSLPARTGMVLLARTG
jgi:neopullulanase